MNDESLKQAVEQGVQRLGCTLPPPALSQLISYVGLLSRWNRVYNLTAVRDSYQMVPRHLLDSLAILPWLIGPQVLDVGSGAGLPGIPLAIACPQLRFTLLDSNGKRTRFMTQAVVELQLANVDVIQSRIEDYRPTQHYNCVVSRAFASLADMVAGSLRLCDPQGQLLAMKGVSPDQELIELGDEVNVIGVERLAVPGLEAERHLVRLVPTVTDSAC